MKSHERYGKNLDLLDRLDPGDKLKVRFEDGNGRRHTKVFEYVRIEGNVLVALDSQCRPRRFALKFCACSECRSRKQEKQFI